MTQPTDVPLPAGADPDNVDNWEMDNGVTSRLVWSIPDAAAQEFNCDVRLVASQRTDGTIIFGNPADEPLVYIDGSDYTLNQAATLTLALFDAIRLAGNWGAK